MSDIDKSQQDTPRVDDWLDRNFPRKHGATRRAAEDQYYQCLVLARQLERELAEAQSALALQENAASQLADMVVDSLSSSDTRSEPTEEMIDAGADAFLMAKDEWHKAQPKGYGASAPLLVTLRAAYRAMVARAQPSASRENVIEECAQVCNETQRKALDERQTCATGADCARAIRALMHAPYVSQPVRRCWRCGNPMSENRPFCPNSEISAPCNSSGPPVPPKHRPVA